MDARFDNSKVKQEDTATHALRHLPERFGDENNQ